MRDEEPRPRPPHPRRRDTVRGGRVREPGSSRPPYSASRWLPASAAPRSHPTTVRGGVGGGSSTSTIVETRAAGAATVDAGQATRSCLASPRDRGHGGWCVARHGRCRHLTGVHPGPVGRRRCRAMTTQTTHTPTPSVADGSVDRESASAVLVLLGFGAVFVAWWPLFGMSVAGGPLDPVALVAHISGMLAGYGVLIMLVLMSRWPVLERGIGADVLARWHASGGRIIVGLVLVHAGFAVLAWSLLTGQDPFSASAQVLTWPGLVTATIGTVLLCAVAVGSARSARTRLRWETWYFWHRGPYMAIPLSFTHQLAGPDLAGHRWLQIGWALLYTFTFALVLRYRFIAPAHAALRHRLRVVAVIPEAPGVVSIVIQGRHLAELQAQPGQFFRWRFLTSGSWGTAHPFSLSAPVVGNRIRLTVKALGDGSERLQRVPVGTRVVAEGPYGAMTAARRTRRDVLLVAGGVGITPMRALFQAMPITPGQDLMLLYRARDRDQLVFREELDALAAHRQARVVYLLGSDPDLLSARSLARLVPGLTDRDVYMCASPGMSATVRRSLQRAGLPPAQLHEERFAL